MSVVQSLWFIEELCQFSVLYIQNGVTVGEREEQSRRAYFEVFGEAKKGECVILQYTQYPYCQCTLGELEVQNSPEGINPVRHKDRLKVCMSTAHYHQSEDGIICCVCVCVHRYWMLHLMCCHH